MQAVLTAGLAPTTSADGLRATGSVQDLTAYHGEHADVHAAGDALYGLTGGAGGMRMSRRLQTSVIKRKSGKISHKATSEITATSSDTGAPMAKQRTTARTEFTKRIANKDDDKHAEGEFATPFVEELFISVKADKNGVTEKRRKTVTRTPAPKGKDKGLDPDGKVVDFPRVPADVNKLKGGKVKAKTAPKPVGGLVKPTKKPATKAKVKKSPPPPAPKPPPPPPKTRTRTRSSPRRGRDVDRKPSRSGDSKRKAPRTPRVKTVKQPPPPVKAPASKKGRGVARFEKFKSSLKARGVAGKGKFGFTVFK